MWLNFFFFLFLNISFISSNNYFIWLKNDNKKIENGLNGKEYLNNHINSMKEIIPTFQLNYIYSNLIMFGYLIYSASINKEYWNEFIEISNIKLAEEIIEYKIAQNIKTTYPVEFISFTPPVIESITVSRDGFNLCTLTNDFIQNISINNSSLHEMVSLLYIMIFKIIMIMIIIMIFNIIIILGCVCS